MQWCSTLSTMLEWMHVHSLSQWVLNSAAGMEHAACQISLTVGLSTSFVYVRVWGGEERLRRH